MLKNERYRGVFVWNRTKKRSNPESGRKTSRRRPNSEWQRTPIPEWRIVPEELWDAVQARFADVNRTGIARCSGFARSQNSRKYLFSGLLRCGFCDSRMVIVSGEGKRGYSKYGCPTHWNRAACPNRLTIRRDRLEIQLFAALRQQIWKPALLDYTIRAFEKQVNLRIAEMRRQNDGSELVRERERLRDEAGRLADAIAQMGHSHTLLERLRKIEAWKNLSANSSAQKSTRSQSIRARA